MKKIKIAQIITRLDWGGPPDIIRSICTSLDPDTFDVTLITGRTDHPSENTIRFFREFKDRIITIPQLQRDIHPLHDIIAFIRLCLLLRRKKYDIVHTHTAKAGALGRLAAYLAGARVIHTSHGHNFYGYFGPAKSRLVVMVERLLTHFTDRITALTELEKGDLKSYGVAHSAKVVVVNSGIELEGYRQADANINEKRNELNLKNDSMLVGMIGRLETVKGPEYFIEAVPQVMEKFPEAEFLIVGEGSLKHSLESRCRELNISDRVTFTGWREDIPELLKILDVVVLPSLNEAVGRILIEAGASGKPVVAAKVGGIPEVVRDGETGLLFPPMDIDALAKALSSLLENEKKKQEMGEAAKMWVDDKFSANRMVSKFGSLYKEVGRQSSGDFNASLKVSANNVDNTYS